MDDHQAPARRASRHAVRRGSAALLWLAVAVLPLPAFAADFLIGRVTHVADGDTLTLSANGHRYRIRLHEIDAPEHGQPWGDQARRALARKVDGKYVRVEVTGTDDYGRTVGKVWLGDHDINRELVRDGDAWAYRHYLKDQSLLDDEAAARSAKRGLWALDEPIPPWRWRHSGLGRARSEPRADDHPAGCRIKGNISRSGEHIYHEPGDPNYAATRIDSSRGERWFCSAQDAERAGWRPPR